jgi:triacylglycerol lipase
MLTRPLQLKYPVVLVHGLGAQSKYGPVEYFYGLPKLLKEANNRITIPNLTAWHTIEYRAQQLKEQINATFPDGKLNLVGHSMGGLDIRYLTSCLDFKDRVASITTIGTPNRGTSIGDLATGLLPDSAFIALNRFLKYFGSDSGALKQVTRQFCLGEFSDLAPNIPEVGYFSATSEITQPVVKNSLPVFWISHRILSKYEGENDGFVSVESAKWGNHICTYRGDHYSQIGQFLGRSRGMDYMQFYTDIFSRLKQEGM